MVRVRVSVNLNTTSLGVDVGTLRPCGMRFGNRTPSKFILKCPWHSLRPRANHLFFVDLSPNLGRDLDRVSMHGTHSQKHHVICRYLTQNTFFSSRSAAAGISGEHGRFSNVVQPQVEKHYPLQAYAATAMRRAPVSEQERSVVLGLGLGSGLHRME